MRPDWLHICSGILHTVYNAETFVIVRHITSTPIHIEGFFVSSLSEKTLPVCDKVITITIVSKRIANTGC